LRVSAFSQRDPAARGLGMTSQRARDRLVERLAAEGIRDRRVLDVMRQLPRHLFIDEALASRAYEDTALPIGHSQTISQPYIVARMTEALLEGGKKVGKVLEVGTGCGYQTAVLAPLVKKIYSIERIAPLSKRAAATLKELGIKNVMLKHGDGFQGWKSQKPFDGILVAAAPLAVPEALFAQLGKGGRLIVPVGPEGAQQLIRFTRNGDQLDREVLGAVAFVPMLGGTA
jgi:protein-L-isoaspartate(D-aspartate) O-methyltransferase